MKITKLHLYPATVRRQYATVLASEGGKPRAPVFHSHFLFVEVQSDSGHVGWGEISDILPEDLPDRREYEELLAAFLVGRDPFDVQRMHQDFRQHFEMEGKELGYVVLCALDMAMYDLQGQAAGRPVHDLLGGAVRHEVEISWVAYIREELDALREEVREKLAQGFRAFKLKVGVDIELDEARVALVREVAGKGVSIKVDANAGWSVAQAPDRIRRLARYGLSGVETPVPREVPADIAAVRRQVDVPILEHVRTPAYGLALIKAEAVDVFNLATTGCGGLWPARQVALLAEAAGIGCLLGSTVEMGLGTLAQLHLAATIPNLTLPSDLIGPGMYQGDVLTEPLRYQAGKLKVPGGVGLGGRIDRKALADLAGRS